MGFDSACDRAGAPALAEEGRMRRDWRERLFLAAGASAAALPRLRGRTRVALALHRALGLGGRRIRVEAELRRPVRFRARLDLGSWLQRLAFVTGEYEADTVEFLLGLREATGTRGYVLDVGANVGLLSVPLAMLLREREGGGGPSVVAIEALPDNAAALRENIRLNGLEEACMALEFAVGDREKAVEIQVEGNLRRGDGTGTANVIADDSGYVCERIPLRLTTLDSLAASGALTAGCSVVKIDTDGYDLKALQGGVAFLGRERPAVFGEFMAHCLRWHGQGVSDVVSFCDGLDYSVWARVRGSWSFTPEIDESAFEQDLLLVPREKASLHERYFRAR